MYWQSKYHLLLFLSAAFIACYSTAPSPRHEESTGQPEDTTLAIDTRIPVHVVPVRGGDFPIQVLTTGVITADELVEVRLRSAGRIEELPIVEGLHVKKGDLLCRQEIEELWLQLRRNRAILDEAEIKLQELLILQGGEADDTNSVAPDVLRTLRISSGWSAIMHDIRQTEYLIRQTRLEAPFAGLVAGVKMKKFHEGVQGHILCTLINPSTFEVTFTVLEKDIANVRRGQKVRVQPIAMPDRDYHAQISTIDPLIDEHGLICVKARIRGRKAGLFFGMKCNVTLEQVIRDRLIVPKEALVQRSNREVVFVADTMTNLAKWKYISISHRNDKEIAVSQGLDIGEFVITDGSLNLSHDAGVVILK